MRKLGTEKSRNSPKVTQLGNAELGLESQSLCLQSLSSLTKKPDRPGLKSYFTTYCYKVPLNYEFSCKMEQKIFTLQGGWKN